MSRDRLTTALMIVALICCMGWAATLYANRQFPASPPGMLP